MAHLQPRLPLIAFVLTVPFVLRAGGDEPAAEAVHDVVIVGGGVAGLSAGFFLTEQGVDNVLVLEKSDRAGGRALVADYLGKPQSALKRIVQKLQLKTVEIPAPMDAALCNGRMYWGSDGAALMRIQHSSLAEYNRYLATMQELYKVYKDIPDFEPRSKIAPLDDLTARKWFQQQGFPKIFQWECDVASRGLFGANLDEISALCGIPEFGFDFEGEKPVRRIGSLDNRPDAKDHTMSYSFVGGIREVPEALSKHLGSRLRLQATVTGVEREARSFRVLFDDAQGRHHVAPCRAVILATTASVALQLGKDVLKAQQKEILQQIHYGPAVLVSLASRGPIFGQAFCLAVLDDCFFVDVYDGTWMSRHFGKPLPDGRTMTYVQIPGQSSLDHTALQMSDRQIVAHTMADLRRLFPRTVGNIVETSVHRVPEAFPVMAPGAYKRLMALDEVNHGGVLLAGDYVIYPTLESAADSGLQAAQRASRFLHPGARKRPTGGHSAKGRSAKAGEP